MQLTVLGVQCPSVLSLALQPALNREYDRSVMDREYLFGCHGNYGSAIKTYIAQCQQAFHPGPQQDMRDLSSHCIQALLYVKKL